MADEGAEANFVPRVFQTELFEYALKKNSILVLGTGSGKTFISIMLIKELGDAVRGPLSKGAKRTVFVAHTVPLVHQQAEAIRKHTGYDVGVFEGSTVVDEWSGEEITNSYERLEFLGDAVLDYLVTGYIFAKHTNLSPGKLTDLRSYYVNNETLGRSAVKLELHKYLQHESLKLNTCIDICNELLELDDGEQDFNREEEIKKIEDIEMPKALGDLVEAILGAIFIDSNQSMETCWKVLQIVLQKEFEFVVSENDIPINRMRALYESQVDFTIQTHPPTEDEPAKCTIQMDSYEDVTGHGKNIRIAKQNAAKIALELINKRNLDSQDYDNLCDITLEAMEEKLNGAV